MTEQEITIQLSDDPFDTKVVKVKVPKGTKLMCTEMYAAEAMSMYDLSDDELNRLTLSEENNNYITQGEIVAIKKETHIINRRCGLDISNFRFLFNYSQCLFYKIPVLFHFGLF